MKATFQRVLSVIYPLLIEMAVRLLLQYLAKNNIKLSQLLDIVLKAEHASSDKAIKQERVKTELLNKMGRDTSDSTLNLAVELGVLLLKARGVK